MPEVNQSGPSVGHQCWFRLARCVADRFRGVSSLWFLLPLDGIAVTAVVIGAYFRGKTVAYREVSQ